MAIYPLRKLSVASALPVIDAWIEQLEHETRRAEDADRSGDLPARRSAR